MYSNTFSKSWLNQNFVTDGVSLKLTGQQYKSDTPNLNGEFMDELFLYPSLSDRNQSFDGSNNISPIDITQYQLTNPFSVYFLQFFRTFFGPEAVNLLLDNDYKNFAETIQKAQYNDLPQNASSERLVTCGMLYRRDAIQNMILSFLTSPKNRLSLGAPTIIPYTTNPNGPQDNNDELDLLFMGYMIDPSTNKYILPTIPPNIIVSTPFGMQQGSIFNILNSGSSILNHGDIILPNRDTVLGSIQLPPGMYNILANIPVDILPGTTISNYVAVITSSGVSGSNTITSLATEVNNTGSIIRKYIQQIKNVTLTNNTTYNIIVKFNYSEGLIDVASNSSSGFKFEAVKIA